MSTRRGAAARRQARRRAPRWPGDCATIACAVPCHAGQYQTAQRHPGRDRARLARHAGESESKERLPNNVARQPAFSSGAGPRSSTACRGNSIARPLVPAGDPRRSGGSADRCPRSAHGASLCIRARSAPAAGHYGQCEGHRMSASWLGRRGRPPGRHAAGARGKAGDSRGDGFRPDGPVAAVDAPDLTSPDLSAFAPSPVASAPAPGTG